MKQSFFKSLPMTASALGDQFGVKVSIGGANAYTNGEKINLPDLGDNVSENKLLGFLVHESAHVRFTQMQPMKKATSEFMRSLLNCIEDVRIEHLIAQVYKGSNYLLSACHEPIFKEIKADISKNPNHPLITNEASTLMFFILTEGGEVINGNDTLGLRSMLRANAQKLFGQNLVDYVASEVKQIDQLSSTHESLEMAKRIHKALLQKATNSSSSSSSGSSKSDESSCEDKDQQEQGNQESESAQETSSQTQSQSQEQSQNQSQSQNQDQSNDQGEDKSGSEVGSSEMSSKSTSEEVGASVGGDGVDHQASALRAMGETNIDKRVDMGEFLKSEFNQVALREAKSGEKLRSPISLLVSEKEQAKYLESALMVGNEDGGLQLLSEAKSNSSYLRRALTQLVQTMTRDKAYSSYAGLRLSRNNIARIATWNTKVFEKRTEKKGIDTAVQILIDASGSITEEDFDLEMKAALATFVALKSINGVNPAISSFAAIPFLEIIKHGQSNYSSSLSRIGSLKPYGNTPTATAVFNAAYKLHLTREKQKVIIVLTDGVPSGGQGPALIKTVRELEQSGVKVFGIGIETKSGSYYSIESEMKKLFLRSTVIHRFEELQRELFQLSKSFLLNP